MNQKKQKIKRYKEIRGAGGLLILNRFICILMFGIVISIFSQKGYTQSVEIFIDPSLEYQEIEGFGASDAWRTQFVGKNWPEEKKNRIAELLFSQEEDGQGNPKGIGLSLWRFYISAGTTEQAEASGIPNEWRRGESFIDENGNYNWDKQEGQQWFLKKAKDAGVEKFLAFSNAAPVFWSKNNKGWNSLPNKSLNLKRKYYEDYADFMVQFLVHFQEEGFAFDYLSPINEPQWDWEKASQEGTPANNENIADLVYLLNVKISQKELDTKILIPEAADLRFLYSDSGKPIRGNQIENFFGTSEYATTNIKDLKNLKNTVSGHSYFTSWPVDSLISIRQQLHNKLTENDLDYWQSEFCILERNDDIGGGGSRDLGINTALYVARVIHADLTLAHAKSWQWWTAISNADFKDGLIYLDTGVEGDLYNLDSLKYDGEFHDSKLLWAIGNYSRFIRPGMLRISTKLDNGLSTREQYDDLLVSAYKDPKNINLVLVAINYSDKVKAITFNEDQVLFLNSYETSKDKNLQLKQFTGNHLNVNPKSIVTLTGKLIIP